MARIAEKVPSWVERLLIPTLEERVRTIVREEVGHLGRVVDARFEAVNARIDSLDKRLPMVQELVEIKARLTEVERRSGPRWIDFALLPRDRSIAMPEQW